MSRARHHRLGDTGHRLGYWSAPLSGDASMRLLRSPHPVLAHPSFAGVRRLPNRWDVAALICVFGALVALAQVARGTLVPLSAPDAVTIYLDPAYLPNYALRTTLRMFAALAASLLFTLVYAALAAKSRRAALVMIPALDILQSVPILGFLTFTVVFFPKARFWSSQSTH